MPQRTTDLWRQKLAPPRAAFPVVVRDRVEDLADLRDAVGLVVVQAPAGFGKTSLMRSLHERRLEAGQPVAWLGLDSADNDPQRFLEYLGAALPPSPTEDPATSYEAILATISELAAGGEELSLFLDDLHVITDATVVGFIRELISLVPGNGRLFLGGRRMPDLQIGRLRTHAQVLDVGVDELRFTASESEQLLANILGRRLEAALAGSLHERTDGWPAVLQLAALTVGRRSDPASYLSSLSPNSADLGSYLAEELLAAQPDEVRELMLRSSVCRTICADLCDHLCDSPSEELLLGIERDNLCLFRLDAQGEWFRFHDLFREHLQQELHRQHPNEIGGLHRRAAEWFAGHDRKTTALEHALASGDTEYAADMADEFAQPLTAVGRLNTLVRATQPLPKAALDARPRLKVYYAVCLSGAFQHRVAAPLIEELSTTEAMASLDPVTRGALLFAIPFQMVLQDRFSDALAACEAHIPQLDPDDAQNRPALFNVRNVCLLHLRRYAEIDEVESEVRALATGVTTYGLVYAECVAGMSELAQGRLSNATAIFEAALRISIDDASPTSAPTAIAAALLAGALYEAGQVRRASDLLDRYLVTITQLAIPDGVIHAHSHHIRIVHRLRGYTEACDAIHQLKRIGYERDLARVVATAWAEQSRLALLEDDPAAAARYLQMAEAKGPYSTLWDESSATLRARLLVAEGQPAAALDLIDAELAALDADNCRRQALRIRIVRAIALKAAGRNAEASKTLLQCLEEARHGPFVRALVDEGDALEGALRELLAKRAGDSESRAFIGLLLEQFDAEHGVATAEADELHERLSGRELEVLGHMAGGLSNQAIADALVVSLPTVKSHVRSILGKLSAKNRTEAVANGRRRKLIPG